MKRDMLGPGRPRRSIISHSSSLTMLVGYFINHFWVHPVHQYTYVIDTKHFVNKIESMHLKPDTWLNTYEITSMYTNMTAMELVKSAAKALIILKHIEVTIKIPKVEYLVELLKILLEHDKFEFDGHLYQ